MEHILNKYLRSIKLVDYSLSIAFLSCSKGIYLVAMAHFLKKSKQVRPINKFIRCLLLSVGLFFNCANQSLVQV